MEAAIIGIAGILVCAIGGYLYIHFTDKEPKPADVTALRISVLSNLFDE